MRKAVLSQARPVIQLAAIPGTHNLIVVNPVLQICHLDEGATLNMEPVAVPQVRTP